MVTASEGNKFRAVELSNGVPLGEEETYDKGWMKMYRVVGLPDFNLSAPAAKTPEESPIGGRIASFASSVNSLAEVVSVTVVVAFLAFNAAASIMAAARPDKNCRENRAKNRMQLLAISFTRSGKDLGCWMAQSLENPKKDDKSS